jgi:hypothetical protein
MNKIKLPSMVEYVLNINNSIKKQYDQFISEHNGQKLRFIEKFANFLSQRLQLCEVGIKPAKSLN